MLQDDIVLPTAEGHQQYLVIKRNDRIQSALRLGPRRLSSFTWSSSIHTINCHSLEVNFSIQGELMGILLRI